MCREVKLLLGEEKALSQETLSEKGRFMLQAKENLRRHSHLASLNSMDEHWESILGAEQGTQHLQFLTLFVLDLHKSMQSLYALNLEMMALLTQDQDGTKEVQGSAKVRAPTSVIRSIKGSAAAKDIRRLCEKMLLEQPLGLREGGKRLMQTICSSRLLWADLQCDEKVLSFVEYNS